MIFIREIFVMGIVSNEIIPVKIDGGLLKHANPWRKKS